MPSIKHRQRIIADNFITKTGLTREVIIPWTDVAVAASGAGLAASVATIAPTTSGPVYFQFTGTSSGCFLNIAVPVPQDMAIAEPAAGSGTVIFDWLNKIGNAKATVIAACLSFIPSGSEWATTGTCPLMSATCTTMTSGSALALNSTSLVQFNHPSSRDGILNLRFGVMNQDAGNTSTSEFHLSSIRLRYKSDRIGS